MRKIYVLLYVVFVTATSFAQPASEIYIFDISYKKKDIILSNPVNITNHKGYDNQPSFHPVKPIIYFSSFNEAGRSDIQSYNYKTKQTVAITQTPEREYSPTVMPDQEHLSCIIQRDNGAQDLGKYLINGGEPSVIINNLVVGYHVWTDNSHVGLFVLGTPNTLHYLRLPTKKDTIIAENIGRSLHKVPGENAFSFVHKVADKDWQIKKFNTLTSKITYICPAVTNHEDLCWLPDGKVLMSDGPTIFYHPAGLEPGWNEVLVKSGKEVLKGVTRLAVSADGKKLAVVVEE